MLFDRHVDYLDVSCQLAEAQIGYYEHQSISATSSYLEACFCLKHVNMQDQIALWLLFHGVFKDKEVSEANNRCR